MSFICDKCKKPQPNGVKEIKRVVATRRKTYPPRYAEDKTCLDKGGQGYETVQEVKLCSACATSSED